MSLLVRSSSLSRPVLLAAALVLAFVGCRSADGDAATSQAASKQAPICLQPGEDETIDALLMQRERAGTVEKELAEEFMLLARKYESRAERLGKHWGGAGKAYGEALLCKPTVEALVGSAYVDAMMEVSQPTPRETLETKLRLMRRAVTRYRLAVDLGDRVGEPMPAEQRKEVEAKIRCLETFVADPDPARPPCPLVEDALRVSGIGSQRHTR